MWEKVENSGKSMFRGITAINIDAKGRLAMPVRYRDVLVEKCNGQVVITIDTEESCLLMYPLPDWAEIEQKIASLPSFNQAARRIQRLLMGHACEVELDSQGRLLVPPLLRDYAKLDKRVMLVGQGKKFELWSDEEWQEQRKTWLENNLTTEPEALPADLQSLSL